MRGLTRALVASSRLRGNAIGDQGGVALAEALKVNYTITMIRFVSLEAVSPVHVLTCALAVLFSLSDNGFGAEWAMALAEALKVNSTITDIE
jgi:hypothetical protein